MAESPLVKSTVPSSASVSQNTAANLLEGTTAGSPDTTASTTRIRRASSYKRFGNHFTTRRGRASKKSSCIPPSSMETNEEAVPGAVPVPGSCNGPSDGDTELEDGNYHGAREDRPMSSLVVASELVEEEEKANLEQKIHEVLDTRLLIHNQTIAFAEAILPIQTASNGNRHSTVDDNRPPEGFFAKNWRWLLVLLLVLVATASGVAIGVALQNGRTTDPVVEPSPTPTTTVPTMSVDIAPSSSPTLSLVEILKPSIVRNGTDDLALLNDGISPQWRALDWLSRDSIALSENQSPSIILNRYVLAVLYFSTSGDDWGQQFEWFLQPTSVCEWNNGNTWESGNAVGVYCVRQSSVQQIRMLQLGLRGTVPWELSLLKSLVFLNLSDNSLTGTLPHELGNLSELEHFYIQRNGVRGSLPTSFGRLTSLTVFWTFENDLTGPFPTEFGQMASLWHLFLHRNALNGTLPTEIGQLSALGVISVEDNKMTGTLPTELGQLTMLSTAWLLINGFTGTVPTEFALLTNLTTLSLEHNNLTGSVDDALCSSPKVWAFLTTDCGTDTVNGTSMEIQCSCCTTCCTPTGSCADVDI